jgi:nitronate monooxygenase
MTVVAGPALAVAISRAGGLGFIGPSFKHEDTIANLEETSSLVQELRASAAFGEKPAPNSQLPVGLAFLLWKDDADAAATAVGQFKPCAVWLYAPRQSWELDEWSRKIRAAAPDTQIWIQIGTVREAKALLQSPERPDVIVVQGTEAGGHGRARDGMGLMALLPEVADVMATSGIPLLAAGGIADGRGVAAAMCLGASGAVMGTRFIASREARIPRGYQDEIVRVSDSGASTARTLLYNHLQGTYAWPEAYDPRVVINKSFTDHQEGKPFDQLKTLFEESVKLGDGGWGPEGRRATYAGASVGLIHEVKDAMDIVRDARNGALERIGSL